MLGNYRGSTLEDIIDLLLTDDTLYFNDLTEKERVVLTSSRFADYLEIQLG